MSSGRRPLDIPVDTGGRRALDRTPRGVEEADMLWPGFCGSEMDRKEGILFGIVPSLETNSSGPGVSGVSSGDPGGDGVSAIIADSQQSVLAAKTGTNSASVNWGSEVL